MTAARLIAGALHLRQNGERAPGGTETWAEWDKRAEEWLREHERLKASFLAAAGRDRARGTPVVLDDDAEPVRARCWRAQAGQP